MQLSAPEHRNGGSRRTQLTDIWYVGEKLKMGKILITGGAGFIGSNLALILLERGHSVRILDLEFSSFAWSRNPEAGHGLKEMTGGAMTGPLTGPATGPFELIGGDMTGPLTGPECVWP